MTLRSLGYRHPVATPVVDALGVTARQFFKGCQELGFVVAIDAELDGAANRALSVAFESNVIGPIDDLNAESGSLTVVGQTILADLDTYFDDSLAAEGLAGLAPGEIVRVSGFAGGDERILATRIDRLVGPAPIELLGIARDVDRVNRRFRIGAQQVDSE